MTPATAQAMYRRQFDAHGRRITIERRVVNADPISIPNVRVRIRGLTPEEVAGGIDVNQRKAIVLAEDVPDTFAPLKKGDYLVVDGIKMMVVDRPDDQTRCVGETLIAYECTLSGS
ncbi:MAG: hypothetical protein J0H60_01500 [Rhizobiales bacterium]|nr:hypothetical protein [Hyphomicrobiales bacterium]